MLYLIKKYIFCILIILIAVGIRFPLLTQLPPSGQNALFIRMPTALASVFSIFLFFLIVKKLTNNLELSYLGAISLTFMPWHIEQSRIFSPIMMGLAVLMISIYLSLIIKSRIRLLFLIIGILIFCYIYNPWFIKGNITLASFKFFFNNVFRLLSVEFLFFKNDSYWQAGLRNAGILLPTTLPIILMGFLSAIKTFSISHLRWYLAGFVIIIVSSFNPLFPEQREFFLITPVLAFLAGLGMFKIKEKWKIVNLKVKTLILIFFIFMSYEYLQFYHFYTVHYKQRIESEVQYEKRNF